MSELRPTQISFRLTDDQEAAVHDLLRRAWFNDGGCAVFAEVRRETFPSPAGAVLVVGLIDRKSATAIRKALGTSEGKTASARTSEQATCKNA